MNENTITLMQDSDSSCRFLISESTAKLTRVTWKKSAQLFILLEYPFKMKRRQIIFRLSMSSVLKMVPLRRFSLTHRSCSWSTSRCHTSTPTTKTSLASQSTWDASPPRAPLLRLYLEYAWGVSAACPAPFDSALCVQVNSESALFRRGEPRGRGVTSSRESCWHLYCAACGVTCVSDTHRFWMTSSSLYLNSQR